MSLAVIARRVRRALVRTGLAVVVFTVGLAMVPAATLGAAGDLDASFSGDGIADMPYGLSRDVVLDRGKIVVAGEGNCGRLYGTDFVAKRFFRDGTVDASLAKGFMCHDSGYYFREELAELTRQQDGKLVMVGNHREAGQPQDILLMRVATDGRLDKTFSGDGRRFIDFGKRDVEGYGSNEYGDSVAMTARSRILFGGSSTVGRLTPSGRRDRSFGRSGVVRGIPGEELIVQPNGKILTGGYGFKLARLRANGTLDSSFGGDGQSGVDFNDTVYNQVGMARQPSDGKYLITGTISGYSYAPDATTAVALARVRRNGELDRSFGNGGRVVTPAGELRANDDCCETSGGHAVAVQADGKIVVGGVASTTFNGEWMRYLTVLRYLPNGDLDTSFGDGGIVRTPAAASDTYEEMGIAIQRNGKILVGGVGAPLVRINDE